MKKLLLILLCLPFIGFGQNVNIPDANFKAVLVGNSTINTNGDSEIQVSEATAFNGTIDCESMNISNLTGIEAFTTLENLQCGSNNLTSLDVTSNTSLIELWCSYNQLTSLDVSNNTNLTRLSCASNQLTTLDVSANTALMYLFCTENQLTTLDVSQNTALENLECGSNNLTSLDVTSNTSLIELWCSYTQLTSFDVSNNTNLTLLYCPYNQLTTLDVSATTALTMLWCEENNQLTSLDLRNGNNTNFHIMDAYDNPNLTCINVDDVAWSTTNWTNIDSHHYFSNNCPPPTSIEEHTTNKELLKVTDILGREVNEKQNTPLFYIYKNGTVEKKIIIE